MAHEGTLYYASAKWYHWKKATCEFVNLDMYKLGSEAFFNAKESVLAISSLPHEVVFENGLKIPPGNPDFCEFIKASFRELPMPEDTCFVRSGVDKTEEPKLEVNFVRRTPYFETHVLRNLDFFMSQFPKDMKLVILTSVIGAQAGRHHHTPSMLPMFIAPITTQETCRLPNDKKRCYSDKFVH